MPRYIVQRTFPDGFALPADDRGEEAVAKVVATNAADGVTWLHSYFTTDNTKSFCVYDAPDTDAVRRVAAGNGLPVDEVTEVRVLDPYFYRP